jgi:hypothetical protein
MAQFEMIHADFNRITSQINASSGASLLVNANGTGGHMHRVAKISLIGTLAVLLLGSAAARADEHFTAPAGQVQLASYGEHELDAARARFYRHWRGDRRERARFERWCAERRAALRHHHRYYEHDWR